MTEKLLLSIIKSDDECEYIEFKTDYFDKDEIGEYISALSNAAKLYHQRFAYMIWGVTNEGHNIVGTNFRYDIDLDNEPYKHFLSRNLSPSIAILFETFLIEGKRIVCLSIPAAEEVVTEYKRERYIRIGSSKELLRKFPRVERKLWSILAQTDSLVNVPSPVKELTFGMFDIYLRNFSIAHTGENFYANNKMLLENGDYNYIAYMFSDQFDMSFKVSKFSGENKLSEFISRKEFGGGCILRVIDQVIDYMDGTVNIVRSYFDSGKASRRDEFLFDKDAFREAYINAVVHNDWSTRTGPAVFLFSNHLEVYSYGSPLTVQRKSEFLKGKSNPINPELAKVFMKFRKYEESGKGVTTILKTYNPEVFEFDEDNVSFTVSIPYNPLALEDNVPPNVHDDVHKNDHDDLTTIKALIKGNPTITLQEMADHIGKSKKTVQRLIESDNTIKHIGPAKGGRWEVFENV